MSDEQTSDEQTDDRQTDDRQTDDGQTGDGQTGDDSGRRANTTHDGQQELAPQAERTEAAKQSGDQANHEIELNLGPCHYCEKEAVEMGTQEGNAGWIPVCDEHRQQASDDGFDVHEAAAPVTAGTEVEG